MGNIFKSHLYSSSTRGNKPSAASSQTLQRLALPLCERVFFKTLPGSCSFPIYPAYLRKKVKGEGKLKGRKIPPSFLLTSRAQEAPFVVRFSVRSEQSSQPAQKTKAAPWVLVVCKREVRCSVAVLRYFPFKHFSRDSAEMGRGDWGWSFVTRSSSISGLDAACWGRDPNLLPCEGH